MKVRSVSVVDELQILKACVVDKSSIARMVSVSDDLQFKTAHSRLIFKWCQKHYVDYGEAPGKENIQSAFLKWSESHDDDALVSRIEDFLEAIDDVEVNRDLIADKIGEYFTKVSLEKMKEDLDNALVRGNVSAAQELVSSWRPVEVGKDQSIDVLNDMNALMEAMTSNEDENVLIRPPSGLGDFFGNDLCRDAFIAFLGPEKRGKTFWLMDMAWRGMLAGRRVAFFGLGDMTTKQYMNRFAVRAAKRPKYPCQLFIHKDVRWKKDRVNKDYEFDLATTPRVFEGKLSWKEAWKGMEELQKRLKSRTPLLKMAAYANSTMGTGTIESVLDSWERDGWTPDIVVLDYADLLLPPRGATDERAASNMNWKQLRKISQERHLLMITATQASAASYDSAVITRSHFSEDKRKLAHVTGMIGLNQTEDEAQDGVMRLNWIARRDDYYNPYNCCLCYGRKELGNLAIRSHFRKGN